MNKKKALLTIIVVILFIISWLALPHAEGGDIAAKLILSIILTAVFGLILFCLGVLLFWLYDKNFIEYLTKYLKT